MRCVTFSTYFFFFLRDSARTYFLSPCYYRSLTGNLTTLYELQKLLGAECDKLFTKSELATVFSSRQKFQETEGNNESNNNNNNNCLPSQHSNRLHPNASPMRNRLWLTCSATL